MRNQEGNLLISLKRTREFITRSRRAIAVEGSYRNLLPDRAGVIVGAFDAAQIRETDLRDAIQDLQLCL
jgi:hypothetical protein